MFAGLETRAAPSAVLSAGKRCSSVGSELSGGRAGCLGVGDGGHWDVEISSSSGVSDESGELFSASFAICSLRTTGVSSSAWGWNPAFAVLVASAFHLVSKSTGMFG